MHEFERFIADEAVRDGPVAAIGAMLESVADAVFVVDAAWHFVYLNASAGALLERPRDELLGSTVWEIFPETSDSRLAGEFRRAIETGVPAVFALAYPGRERWVEVRAYPFAAGLLVYFHDITATKVAELALREREARLQSLFQAFPLPTYTWRWAEDDFVFADFNIAADTFARGTLRAKLGQSASALYRDMPTVTAQLLRCRATGATTHHDLTYRSPSTGEDTTVRVTYVPVAHDLVAMHSEDLTALRAAESARQASEGRYRALVEQAADGICVFDEEGRFVEVNAQACAMLGYTREELLLLRTVDVIAPADLAARPLPPLGAGAPRLLDERLMLRKDGTTFLSEASVKRLPDGLKQAILRDVSERRQLEARLAHQATHDSLTGLPNRARFFECLGQALAYTWPYAVLLLDLDHFKDVNDTLGHDAGDRLLREVAARLRSGLRDGDTVARLGGDEFVALLPEVTDAAGAVEIAGRLRQILAPPVVLDGRPMALTASIGIAMGVPGYTRAEEVLRDADVALYRAKAAGRDGYAIFHPQMQLQLLARTALEEDLLLALTRGEFILHYQPLVDLATGRVTEVEALVRWHCPGEGLIRPGRFLAVLEEIDRLRDLDRWVLRSACRQASAWHARNPDNAPRIGVNLAPATLRAPGLVDEVVAALEEAEAQPGWLRLEITEGAALADAADAIATLRALKALGVGLSLDDFGTGYSSLSHLQRLPVDTLKLDGAFFSAGGGARDRAIVRAVTELARGLGLAVVAEGLETAAQVAWARDAGCEGGQGYYFARPLPPEDLDTLLTSGSLGGPGATPPTEA